MNIEKLRSLGLSDAQINALNEDTTENKVVVELPVKTNTVSYNDKPLRPTSIHELKEYTKGAVVELPPFAEGQPFIARLRRPSLMVMAKTGQIPNELIGQATDIFAKGSDSLRGVNKNTISDMYEIIERICEASLVEPTLKDIESAGLTLSDDQMMAIFSYSQGGVEALKSFRNQ